jgi:hypothetical protein
VNVGEVDLDGGTTGFLQRVTRGLASGGQSGWIDDISVDFVCGLVEKLKDGALVVRAE